MGRSPFRVAAAVLAAALLAAACGDDDTSTATVDDTAVQTAMADEAHGHDGIEIGDADQIPTVSITATPDAKAGINLRVETTGIAFAPEHASTEHVPGEGHGHVYVDGEKYGRVYGEWMYLDVEPGEHEIRVDLNANDHSPLLVDGEPIDDAVTVDVPEPAAGHSHPDGFEAEEPYPTVELAVTEDPKSGWNVHVETTGYVFAPEKASTMATTSGEGHAHLYVDGRKITRMYGEWFHVDQELEPGEHEFRVELSANDHAPYLAAGAPIEATQTVLVEGSAPAVAGEGAVVEVTVSSGQVEGGGRVPVALGDTVTIRVTSDVADRVHLHGYDVLADVGAGETAELTFTADIPGVFEVELEDAGIPLLELEVS